MKIKLYMEHELDSWQLGGFTNQQEQDENQQEQMEENTMQWRRIVEERPAMTQEEIDSIF